MWLFVNLNNHIAINHLLLWFISHKAFVSQTSVFPFIMFLHSTDNSKILFNINAITIRPHRSTTYLDAACYY